MKKLRLMPLCDCRPDDPCPKCHQWKLDGYKASSGEVLPVSAVISYWSLAGPETFVLKSVKPKRLWRRQRVYCFLGGVGVSIGQRVQVPEDELVERLKQPRVAVALPGQVVEE